MATLDNPDLEITEIMIFERNGYVIVREASTGIDAFEPLWKPVSQFSLFPSMVDEILI